ncbi:epidermal retinol dehydrogenase 2-like [Leptidea sinapis]|uniref:epidermal retinol dehydrogenase 2-like n=1 Tax=Leptidea sinapis TaxID=189913 RepID=UPI0021289AD5|nr:epidermal retinol dehydrogenase 2-like [Leptidea sinapis]
MAIRFAALGATVVCVDINDTSNEETVKMIQARKQKAFKYRCDVTERSAVMQLAERVRKEVGDVAVLVNNAGMMPCNPVLQQTEQEITLMNKLNINANIWMIQAFLPVMVQRNYGHIVAMSSMAGLQGIKNLVPYCGSKYAVKGIMDSLAVELRSDPRDLSGIKLTTIFPYIINTGLCKKPRIRFKNLMKVVEPGEAADIIINAMRREYTEISIPQDLHYLNRYIYRLLPLEAGCTWMDFIDAGVDAHG